MAHAQNSSPYRDVTGDIDLSRPAEVATTIHDLLQPHYGARWDDGLLARACEDTASAFAGTWGGLLACDTPYHDLRHALDTALLAARLIDGWQRSAGGAGTTLNPRVAMLQIILALMHDIGMLRKHDEAALHGATLTPIHEARSSSFAGQYLLATPLADLAPLASLIDATRLASKLEHVGDDPIHRLLAQMLGTADLMSQLADRFYLEKCRDFLYREFLECGLARGADGRNPNAMYTSPEDLLRKTPGFAYGFVAERLDRELGGQSRVLEKHFRGVDPYQEEIDKHHSFLCRVLDTDNFGLLRRQPQALWPAGEAGSAEPAGAASKIAIR